MVVDGIELLRMVRDGEIKHKTRIKDNYGNEYIYKLDEYDDYTLYEIDEKKEEIPDYSKFVDKSFEFEILEDDEEIDIQAIEEVNYNDKINELIKAVKQLDKKMKGE